MIVPGALTARLDSRLNEARQGRRKFKPPVNLTDFKKQIWNKYEHLPYQALIDTYLTEVARYVYTGGEEGIGRLMIFLPPRHGKTLTVSRLFPAWAMGYMPHIRLIMLSYGADLARKNSRYVRNVINSSKFQSFYPNVRLAEDTRSATEWDIANYGGGMISAGIGGGITGHGGNIIILDDMIKNRAEAESPTYRKRNQEAFADDISTRLEEPGGAMVLMNTRWHTADLPGWLLSLEDAEEWVVLSLPALAEEKDPLGRQPNEALWEARYSQKWLMSRKEKYGIYSFSSVYQQNPIVSKGGLFDTLHIKIVDGDQLPDCIQWVRFYDLAVTKNTWSDYTVGLKLGVTADERFVIDHVWRVQREAPEVNEGIIQNAFLDGTKVPIILEAEKAGIIQLDYLLRDPRLRAYNIGKQPPEGDKFTRATAPAARVNNERVLMRKAPWNQAVLDELAVFNSGQHDDIVDAFSGAYEYLSKHDPDHSYVR